MLTDRCPRGGSLDRHTDEEIALKHPAIQVFEQKTKAPAAKAPAAQTLAATFPKPRLTSRAASEAG